MGVKRTFLGFRYFESDDDDSFHLMLRLRVVLPRASTPAAGTLGMVEAKEMERSRSRTQMKASCKLAYPTN